ncbi:CHAT domain-containing protein [Sabulilitoribacter multivorans]|uniref:CHAT domain-containing protein n=1 Tax=Flaviramulus multivorans TaxID=1304750 RepID=A0ABS9IMQ2_9FLAO|nr:tetratricopeptide repeat protein [Flaviramulus multivorans]MCF7561879.1 CHAT domain-containing protein [Flaviramulus multivorans]
MNKFKCFTVFFALQIAFYSSGQSVDNYNSWENHINFGYDLLDNENYQDALTHFVKAHDIAEKIFSDNDYDYYFTTYTLGYVYDNINEFEKAITFYLKGINNFESNKIGYAEVLKRIGELYMRIGDYNNSLKFLNESLLKVELIEGNETLNYSRILNNLSILYKRKEEYEKAFNYNSLSSQIIEKLYGIDSDEYASNLISLSQIYIEIGEYEKALLILDKVLLKLHSQNSKNSSVYIQAIYTKALIHHYKYEFQKEIPLYEEVKNFNNKNDDAYISANTSLSVAYQELGDYENALKFAKEVANNTPQNDQNHSVRFQNLAYYYSILGEFDKSLENYEIALESCKNKLGVNHSKYAELLDAIGQLYVLKGDLIRAKELFQEALRVFLNNFDENHSKYGFYLNNYTSVLLELSEYDEAISLIKKNIKISEDNSNLDNIDFYRKQLNLARAYNKTKNFKEAKKILEKYSKMTEEELGNEHPEYGNMLKYLGEAYVGLGDYKNAIPVLESFNSIIISQIKNVFEFRSEQEKKAFLNITTQNFDELQSLAYNLNTPIAELNEINLNNQIMLKGLLLNNSKNVLSELATLNNASINNKIYDYRTLKTKLSRALSLPMEERILDVDSLKNQISDKESELVKLYSSNFMNSIELIQSWKESQLNLKEDDIAIEFSRFHYYEENKLTDSILYAAYIYKKDWEHPKMIPLFEEKQLKALITKKTPNQLYVSRGSKARSTNNSKAIFDLVWRPLEKIVTGSSNIYYTPSGLLNQISFAALGEESSKTLSNKFNLFQLSTTGNLKDNSALPKAKSALLIGGIDYDNLPKLNEAQDSILITQNNKLSEKIGDSWIPLPGTLREVDTIGTILKANSNKVDVWKGTEANETNFKKLHGRSPNILHIATHGFFYENVNNKPKVKSNLSTEDQYRYALDPLLRSGLLFAGANHTWKFGHRNNQEDDGILTALEISNMDLSNTDIVVLSACETGLGDIDGSEGVYGLQRAFKMAGVDILIMSLWEVPDIETAEFMTLFYGNWMKTNKVKEAFNQTQKTIQAKYSSQPEKWAAFVLLE